MQQNIFRTLCNNSLRICCENANHFCENFGIHWFKLLNTLNEQQHWNYA